jgi:hypothetical protein
VPLVSLPNVALHPHELTSTCLQLGCTFMLMYVLPVVFGTMDYGYGLLLS